MELTGKRFGKLLVLRRGANNSSGKIRWICQCDCGNTRLVIGTLLTRGRVTSCGCTPNTNERLYCCWRDMRQRCNNPKVKSYKYYGDRGIAVCEEWDKSFSVFADWALANGYANDLTLDRIDARNGYFPDNCRWIDLRTNQLAGFANAYNSAIASGRWPSTETVDFIREHKGIISARELCRMFNIKSTQTIYNIWHNTTRRKVS